VILIGEIRDRETMEHAIAFAETGHLCMATLHANSANQALDRIINFFPEERRAAAADGPVAEPEGAGLAAPAAARGGKGRVAAVEILLNTPLVSDLIFKGEVHEIKEMMKKSRELGMQTFDQALFDLYEAGLISYEDALRNADSVNDLRLQIKLNSAFLGLGVMGYPMAGHLARAGHQVTVYNRTAKKAEQWVEEYGGKRAATPREAAAGAQIVFSCVGNDDDLRSVVLGADGAFAGMAPGASSSTTPPPRPRWRASCTPRRAPRACTSSTRRSRAARPARSTAR
jgi:hypothetical protein